MPEIRVRDLQPGQRFTTPTSPPWKSYVYEKTDFTGVGTKFRNPERVYKDESGEKIPFGLDDKVILLEGTKMKTKVAQEQFQIGDRVRNKNTEVEGEVVDFGGIGGTLEVLFDGPGEESALVAPEDLEKIGSSKRDKSILQSVADYWTSNPEKSEEELNNYVQVVFRKNPKEASEIVQSTILEVGHLQTDLGVKKTAQVVDMTGAQIRVGDRILGPLGDEGKVPVEEEFLVNEVGNDYILLGASASGESIARVYQADLSIGWKKVGLSGSLEEIFETETPPELTRSLLNTAFPDFESRKEEERDRLVANLDDVIGASSEVIYRVLRPFKSAFALERSNIESWESKKLDELGQVIDATAVFAIRLRATRHQPPKSFQIFVTVPIQNSQASTPFTFKTSHGREYRLNELGLKSAFGLK